MCIITILVRNSIHPTKTACANYIEPRLICLDGAGQHITHRARRGLRYHGLFNCTIIKETVTYVILHASEYVICDIQQIFRG